MSDDYDALEEASSPWRQAHWQKVKKEIATCLDKQFSEVKELQKLAELHGHFLVWYSISEIDHYVVAPNRRF